MTDEHVEPLGGEQELLDWYQKLRRRVRKSMRRRAKSGKRMDAASEQLVECVAVLPDLFHLAVRLFFDRSVPATNKGALIAGIVYVVSPIDLIPDPVPGVGWLDDLVVMALALNKFLDTKDESVSKAVSKYWAGKGDLFDLVKHILETADEAITFLPKKLMSVLKGMFK